jgi:hypothetical protein
MGYIKKDKLKKFFNEYGINIKMEKLICISCVELNLLINLCEGYNILTMMGSQPDLTYILIYLPMTEVTRRGNLPPYCSEKGTRVFVWGIPIAKKSTVVRRLVKS